MQADIQTQLSVNGLIKQNNSKYISIKYRRELERCLDTVKCKWFNKTK